MKAVIYSRFSTDRQNESSIADQIRVCSEYAKREGMQIVNRFEDQGISGAALGNRPGVLKMQEAALARRFDVLLVTDLSRLSRSNGDLSKMIDRLVAKGVRVIGVQDGYDSHRKGHKLQAGLSGIIGEAFREMIKDRTYAALESRAKENRPTGGKAYGYDTQDGRRVVNSTQAAIVREIFERYADGASCRSVAAELNARGIPSPGSGWARKKRRASGWMGSAIRAMLRNPIYTGTVQWNTSEWLKDPDTGNRVRRPRPKSEWITHADESLRIVPYALWKRAQRRTRFGDDERLKSGGTSKYLLSGLLRCGVCGSHYVIADSRSYACAGHVDGRACANSIRVRRDHAEAELLDPVRRGLLAPERIAAMGKEMQRYYNERMKAQAMRSAAVPRELTEIESRLARLRERLRSGDPDMTAEDLQAAIDRAEAKRRELSEQPADKESAKILSLLPKAAALYRQQIADGLDGDPRAALKARVILRDLFGGKIQMNPGPDGSLWAEFAMHPAALLRTAGAGTCGSGGRI